MDTSVRKPIFQVCLAIMFCLLSGCDGVTLFGRPKRIITVEASATELAALAQSGLTPDMALANSLSVLQRRLESETGEFVAVEREGANRVRIVMPDSAIIRDAHHLAAVLKSGGRLEFRNVDLSVDLAALKEGPAPPGSEILPAENNYGVLAVLIGGGLRGGHVSDAVQEFDAASKQPVVSIIFDDVGKRQFARMTSQSVGRPIAIVLDRRVIAAPNVNEPISGGVVQISGNFTVASAQQTASLLRAGYLPVSFTLVENKAAPRN